MLSYLPRKNCHHEYVAVTPRGFQYRNKSFFTISDLLGWFKKHFRDPLPEEIAAKKEAIQRVSRELPQHILQSLSEATNPTQLYPENTSGHAATVGYEGYLNTLYTPLGQNPFVTPYQTPHLIPHPGQTAQIYDQQFLQPAAPSAAAYHRSTASPWPTPSANSQSAEDARNWKNASEAWARQTQKIVSI